jgi:hypothetical protein
MLLIPVVELEPRFHPLEVQPEQTALVEASKQYPVPFEKKYV